MSEIDLTTTNILLGVIAGVQLVFLLGVVAAGLYGWRTARRLEQTMSALEREHVRPLRGRVERILDDLTRVSARVEEQSARIDAGLTGSLDVAERQARRVASAVGKVARETSAVASGVRAAVSAVGEGWRSTPPEHHTESTGRPPLRPVAAWPTPEPLITQPERGDIQS